VNERLGQRSEAAHVVDFRFAPREGWTLICRPDDPFKTLVREDGALLYDFDGRWVDVCRFETVLEFSAETAHSPVAVEQRTESPRRPIVLTTVQYPNQSLELTAFGYEEGGRRTDVVLWAITAAEHADEVLAALRIEPYFANGTLVGPPGVLPANELFRVSPDAPLVFPAGGVDGLVRLSNGAPPGRCAVRCVPQTLIEAHARGFRPTRAYLTTPQLLAPGERAEGALLVPLNHDESGELNLDWARRALERERAFWDRLELMPRRIEVADPRIQDLLISSSRNILQAREIEHGAPVMHVGPTIYRSFWLVDGHFLLEAARYLGFDDAADAGLAAVLRRAKADGSIREFDQYPNIKETAVAIATLVRQTELSGDLGRLRSAWPIVRAGVAHIEQLRQRAEMLPVDHPLHGLMPEAFADGGVAGCRAELSTAVWTLAGLRYAIVGAELLREKHDVSRFSAGYEALRQAFERSAGGLRRALPGSTAHYLPMCPPESGSHQFLVGASADEVPRWREIQPESATWALCHAIWPGEVFAPDAVWVRDLLALFDARDDEQGIPATTGWLSYRSVWAYAASFAAHVWLYAGRPDKAVDYLYALANHAFPTRVWREEQSLSASGNRQVWGDMPHNWASAEFIRLVRHLIVFERGDDLELLPGVPEEWMRPGAQIVLDHSPTRFGAINLAFESDHDGVVVRVNLQPSGHPSPRRVRLFLPQVFHGHVTIDHRPAPVAMGSHVELALRPYAPLTIKARQ
jgi:hypothetical protein